MMDITTAHLDEINFVKENIATWKDIPDGNIWLQKLCGISNIVYKVMTNVDVTPQTFILRKFGDTEAVVDKDKESLVFNMMAEVGRGPKCFAKSGKYRCEEYFEAAPIKTTQINEPYWRRKLAVALAKHHSLNSESIKKENIIIERLDETKFYDSYNSKCVTEEGFTSEQAKLLSEIKTLGSREEREYVRSIIPYGNLVFSHNDTLNGNILVTEKDKRIVLIDYEYSGYNNRAYDAANLFVESMMTYDNPEPPYFEIDASIFPKLNEVQDFARYYIYASLYCENEIDDAKLNDDAWLLEIIEKDLDSAEFEKEMKLYLDEFQKCCLLSQYYWSTWGIVMAKPKGDPKSFDYISFSYEKFKCYLKWKDQIAQGNSIFE